jgi:hypothetical protein
MAVHNATIIHVYRVKCCEGSMIDTFLFKIIPVMLWILLKHWFIYSLFYPKPPEQFVPNLF